MRILAVNSGSSSVKYRLFDSEKNFQLLGQGAAERIGLAASFVSDEKGNKKEIFLPDHHSAIHALFNQKMLTCVDAVGHRIVHGGEKYKKPCVINQEVIKEIAVLAQFSPLHSEPNRIGIEVLQELLPQISHVAMFDTSCHSKMPPKAYLYAIPLEYYEKYKLRKYGFHGINHLYVAKEAARLIKRPFNALKIITCHLGNGCSITAFKKGKSIDNSMGLTPLEGVVMGTRSGDLDPSIILYFIEKFDMKPNKIRDLLNKKSGLLGLSGKSDMRDVIACAKMGDKLAKMAIEIFIYRIQKAIGACVAALNGADALVFTGGIGENSSYIRALILKSFTYLGASIDSKKNKKNASIFSDIASKPFLLTIPANEEMMIAKATAKLLFRK